MPKKSRRLNRFRNTAAPLASALIVLVFGHVTRWSVARENDGVRWVQHTHYVIIRNQDLLASMLDAETGERGFLITNDIAFLAPYRGAENRARQRLTELRSLTRDNPDQQVRLDMLGGLMERRLRSLEEQIAARATTGFESARSLLVTELGGKALMDSVRQVSAAIEDDENRLLAMRSARLDRSEAVVLWVLIIGMLAAAAVALLLGLTLSRYASTQEELNDRLHEQADELEAQTVELEAVNEELQTSNELLEDRTAEAETANRVKARFLATMSHDLRTPLNAIVGYANLLELGIHGPVSAAQIDDLQRITRSSEHLLSMINDVLNYSKIEAGALELRIQPTSIRAVMHGIEPLVAPQVKAKALHYSVDPVDPGLMVAADRERLDQILVNLVTNAIKFTANDGSIRMSCNADETSVRIVVTDTGRGIPADRIHTIFDAFVQVRDGRDTDGRQGVGLGLTICRELARAMNGDLMVESVVGDGSTFTVRLPRTVG